MAGSDALTVLDGALGTELADRGVDTSRPGWSAGALERAPEVVMSIHRAHAEAGATLHTANTFRTTARGLGRDWARYARRAVNLARSAIPRSHRIAGSIAPLEDCYRPDRSPGGGESVVREHAALAEVLVEAGCEVLLCETFPRIDEALAAVRAAKPTGVEVWLSLTAGWRADLMSSTTLAEGAQRAVDIGVDAVLVNCVPAAATHRYVSELVGLGVPFGAYANAGLPPAERVSPQAYARAAQTWIALGATLVGGCCGTGPAHIAELAATCHHAGSTQADK